MALANILVEQSIANDGQPRAVLVDSQGKPLIRNTSEQNKPKTPTEEQNRETQFNIQKMVDLLEVIAANISGKDIKPATEKEESSSFRDGIGYTFGFYFAKYVTKFFGLLMSGLGALVKFTGRLLLRSILIGLASLLTLPLGVIAAIVLGFAGLVRGIKEAFQVFKDGGTFTDVLSTFMDGFTKGFLNFAFDAIDWVLSIFGIDLFPDNLGDKIVNAVKELFTSIIDYIKSIPSRLGGALKEALVPKGGTIDKITGGYFSKEVPQETPVSNTTFKMPEGNKTGITSDLSGVTAPITKVEPATSVIPKPISGSPSPSFKTKMTEDEAKQILTPDVSDKFTSRMADLAMEPRTTGKELSDSDIDAALSQVGSKEQVQAFKTLESGQEGAIAYAKRFNTNLNVRRGNMVRPQALSTTISSPSANDPGSLTSNLITPGTPSDVGNQIMSSSSAIEDSKMTSTSSPIIVSAPSSTVNAPKESNLMTSRNVRNDENTLSKYVGSLYGSNV
jgi:hypothetical protein